MTKIAYENWTPGADARAMLVQANEICTNYEAQGYDLTLRQLYYQFVARDLIPNSQQSYKRLGDIVNKGRMAGYLDWDHIVDRTRNLRSISHWATPGDVIHAAASSYHNDLWADQPEIVEVWVEKEALAGVVQRAAETWDCSWFSCRGYVSQSEMWGAARRLGRYLQAGKSVTILHLGDHDPSGIDMTRDIRARLENFIYSDWLSAHTEIGISADGGPRQASISAIEKSIQVHGGYSQDPLEIRRIALNMDQVEQYDPPPNPAKITDSRARGYISEYGGESWELDALDPATLDALIQDHIGQICDVELLDEARRSQERDRVQLTSIAGQWADVVATHANGNED